MSKKGREGFVLDHRGLIVLAVSLGFVMMVVKAAITGQDIPIAIAGLMGGVFTAALGSDAVKKALRKKDDDEDDDEPEPPAPGTPSLPAGPDVGPAAQPIEGEGPREAAGPSGEQT